MTELLHASVVARRMPGGWAGVLLSGPSGAGKSDLALRLLGRGWRLVGDDYCHVWNSGSALYARGDERIEGRLEARGLGVIRQPSLTTARLVLWVDCGQAPPERMPSSARRPLAGLEIPVLALRAIEASAPNKVEAAFQALGAGQSLP